MTDVTPEEMHAIGMADPNSTPLKDILPGAAREVEQTIKAKNAFRSRSKISRDDRKHMHLPLCARALDKIVEGLDVSKATFGLTPREKEYVNRILKEYREWEKDPAAYIASLEEPGKGEVA